MLFPMGVWKVDTENEGRLEEAGPATYAASWIDKNEMTLQLLCDSTPSLTSYHDNNALVLIGRRGMLDEVTTTEHL